MSSEKEKTTTQPSEITTTKTPSITTNTSTKTLENQNEPTKSELNIEEIIKKSSSKNNIDTNVPKKTLENKNKITDLLIDPVFTNPPNDDSNSVFLILVAIVALLFGVLIGINLERFSSS